MFGLGFPELLVIFFVIFLLFGAKALPEVAKGLGQAMQIFKKQAREISDDIEISSNKPRLAPDSKEESTKASDVVGESNDFDSSKRKDNWRDQTKTKDTNA